MGFRRSFLLAALALPLLGGVAAAEPVTLNFWTAWDPSLAEVQAAKVKIADFEAAHPDIRIATQVIAYDALHDKLVAAIAGGDAPDLSWGLSEWLGELKRMGALADVHADDGSAEGWGGRSAIYPNVLAALSADGELQALPNYLGIRALLYHADMLKAAGIAEPPKTWDDLVADAKAIKAVTGKPGFGIAGRGVRAPQELLMYLAQGGALIAERGSDGKYRNRWADDPGQAKRAADVFAFYRRLLDEGVIPGQAAGWGWEEEDTNFSLGQYAMVVDGAWIKGRATQSPREMKDVLVSPPPFDLRPATFLEVAPLYLFKGRHQAAAWTFASYMMGETFQSTLFPDDSPRRDVKGDDVWGEGFTSLTPTGVAFPPIALGAIPRDMEEAVGRVLLKKEAPAEVAAWLGKAVNKSLRQSGQLSAQ